MILQQIRSADGTGTLTYIIGDEKTRQAAVIDPNQSDVDRIVDVVDSLGLKLTTIIDTHTHADHYTGAQVLKERTGAMLIMHALAGGKWEFVHLGDAFGIGDILRANVKVEIDRFVEGGETISVGDLTVQAIHTPGHTNDHIALLVNGHLFTGDVLLVGQAGRSDLPSGNVEEQYTTLFEKIMKLPESTIIHPGHDYEGNEYTTLAAEKRSNPFLAMRSKAEYKAFVEDFFPPVADAFGNGVVLQCGTRRVFEEKEEFTNITPKELEAMMTTDNPLILDVREPKELALFGAISGVLNIPMGSLVRGKVDLTSLKGRKIVVVCQTGGRSIEAAHYLVSKGLRNVSNLVGGTLGWIIAGKQVSRVSKERVAA